jgi:hypothetical protein
VTKVIKYFNITTIFITFFLNIINILILTNTPKKNHLTLTPNRLEINNLYFTYIKKIR